MNGSLTWLTTNKDTQLGFMVLHSCPFVQVFAYAELRIMGMQLTQVGSRAGLQSKTSLTQ